MGNGYSHILSHFYVRIDEIYKQFQGVSIGMLEGVDCLIFDIDGVLLNCESSFPLLIQKAVEVMWDEMGGVADAPGYSEEFQRILKRHGAFNDDYDIVWLLLCIAKASGKKELSKALPSVYELETIILGCGEDSVAWCLNLFKGVVNQEKVRALCADLYYGDDATVGFYENEKVLLSVHWKELPLPTAIYTGRNIREWEVAKKRLGWEDFPDELIIHSDTGIKKPSPEGLKILCDRLNCDCPLFFGDTASDKKSLEAFNKGYFVAIGSLLPESNFSFSDPHDALRTLLGIHV